MKCAESLFFRDGIGFLQIKFTTFASDIKHPNIMTKEKLSSYVLPKTVTFIVANTSRFSSEEYVPYQLELFKHVKEADATKIKLPAGMADEWDRLNGIGMDINKVTAASANTKAKRKKDAERDRILTHLFGMIRQQCHSPLPAKAEAAERLQILVNPYLGAQGKRVDVKSGLILGLENDLGRASADMATVGLTDVLSQLHTANADYMALGGASDAEDIKRDKLPSITDIRPLIDRIHQVACQTLQANYLTTTNADERTAIEELAEKMNKVTQRYKSRHNISEAEKKAAAEKNPKEPKEPKDPKAPKNPKTPDDPKQPKEPKTPSEPKDPKAPEGGGESPKTPGEKPKEGGDDGDPDIHLPEE